MGNSRTSTKTIWSRAATLSGSSNGTAGAATPVLLSGLSKRFSPQVLAVDSLDLAVEQGQIFGLLGPNGAGKTTTLRMLLGLVHPTAGSARIFGHIIHPGHPVLRRVGALVEGPGFVPHLSGMQNLDLFWRAGGQRLRDSNLGEALDIAGLGNAIHRKVRTYSKGMQQRLAVAQALLNKPELLLLDEPTVGLDPGEMREIRALVREVAERGATVLLSSHILAEVEQVCTHAAVMDRGRLVASGTVAELTASGSSVYLEVDALTAAAQLLGSMPGVLQVSNEGAGLSLRLDGLQREALVAALVHAGVGVRTVTSRHRLEDAFFQMLEGEA